MGSVRVERASAPTAGCPPRAHPGGAKTLVDRSPTPDRGGALEQPLHLSAGC